MNLGEFQAFVGEHIGSYAGVNPETDESLGRAEAKLGCQLPDTLKWLLVFHGYSSACGISSLADAVATTLLCRERLKLPTYYVVLNDWGDAGVVYLDSHTGTVTWGDSSDLHALADGGHVPDGNQTYADYPTWTVARMEAELA